MRQSTEEWQKHRKPIALIKINASLHQVLNVECDTLFICACEGNSLAEGIEYTTRF